MNSLARVLLLAIALPSTLANASLEITPTSCLPRGKEIVHIALNPDGRYECARTLHGRFLDRTFFSPPSNKD